MATSIAFWALYSGVVACASITGFSLLRGVRDTQPMIAGAQSPASHRTEAVPMSGTVPNRPAAVSEFVEPQIQAVDATGSQPPQSLPQAEPGPPDAIGQLITQLTGPAEASRDSVPATSVGPSHSITPTGPAEATPLSDAGRNAGDTPQPASTDEAKAIATAPTGNGRAALPSPKLAGKSRRAHAPRRDARLRQSVGRRPSARYPQPEYAGERRRTDPSQGSGAQDIDVARGYGHGAYGPAPYADTGY